MARKRNLTPSYLKHKQTGQARAVWSDALGIRRQKLLPGPFDSPESRTAFAKLQLEILSSPTHGPMTGSALSVAELLAHFLTHAEKHYRHPDGEPTEELAWYKFSMRPLRELFGETPAASFGPLALKTVRQKMVSDGLARPTINARVRRLKHIFRWATSEELVPPSVHTALTTVVGLQRGRCDAPEPKPIRPVAVADVDATTPFLSPTIAGMVRVQLLTGMRPRRCAASGRRTSTRRPRCGCTSRPTTKTPTEGKSRVIAIGPRAQEVLKPFLEAAGSDGFVFSPRRELEQRSAERSANRTTRYYASRQGWQERKAKPNRAPGESYTPASYGQAIRRAVAKANDRRERMANGGEYDRVPGWAPNQLRHAHAALVRREYGLDHVQATLGHASVLTSQIYATRRDELAAEVASRLG
jgi:integrase